MKNLIKRVRRSAVNSTLTVVLAAALFLMLKTSDDRLVNGFINSWAEQALAPFATGNQIIFNVSVGVIVSIFIYLLLVWLPERRKRTRVKRNLQRQYDLFKEDCITTFLGALNQTYNSELINNLKHRDHFKKYFKEPATCDQDRWDAVFNRVNDYMLKNLLIELEILRNEVLFTLAAVDIDDEEIFAFLKRLSQVVYRIKHWSQESEDHKELFRFLWSIHTGWNIIYGYQEKDIIAETIAAI
ncbi:MAG: hypothetical protein PHI97_34490 [Desulfobulbus sp.]|nr:hypothetical protein [Desulfobulbus sp.]